MTSDITLPPEPKTITMGKPYPRLLVVGDQPTYKQTLPEIFHRDHDVLAAGNGVQAFEICHNSLPDLILLDVVMPGTDGLEICRQLKADPDTKGSPRQGVASRCFRNRLGCYHQHGGSRNHSRP